MRYNDYMNGVKVSRATKERFYDAAMQKVAKRRRVSVGVAFAFASVLILVLGVGTAAFFALRDRSPADETKYILAFSGAYDETRIPFDTEGLGEDAELDVRAESLAALKAFAAENDMPFYDGENVRYDDALSKKIREYDEAFFKKKTLIVVLKLEKEYDLEKFDEMQVRDGVLTVYLRKPTGNATYTEVSAFAYVIETDKEYVADVSEIRTEVRSEGVWSDYSGKTYMQMLGYFDDSDKTPEELVRRGVITAENLATVYQKCGARYENGEWSYRYVPKSEENAPGSLSEELRYEITQSVIDRLWKNAIEEAYAQSEEYGRNYEKMLEKFNPYKYELLKIDKYYGTYDGCVAVGMIVSVPEVVASAEILVVWQPAA